MGYRHSMTCYTEGIRAALPKWRGLDGMMSVFWDAQGNPGARAYYLSPDPRIVIFFNDVSAHIRMSDQPDSFGRACRPMTRAVYVPAGAPLWTSFTAAHSFSHLDLHLHHDRALRFLSHSLGRSAALAALRCPVEIQDTDNLQTLARLLVDEIAQPSRHGVYAESLVGSIIAGLLDIPAEDRETVPAMGGLTQAQMNRLLARMGASSDHRLSVAEMASAVGLSESWFANVFKKTTGKTPLQWQMGQRIELAQKLLLEGELALSDVAARLGFSDQAHLTRAFRQMTGNTPAAWRRTRLLR